MSGVQENQCFVCGNVTQIFPAHETTLHLLMEIDITFLLTKVLEVSKTFLRSTKQNYAKVCTSCQGKISQCRNIHEQLNVWNSKWEESKAQFTKTIQDTAENLVGCAVETQDDHTNNLNPINNFIEVNDRQLVQDVETSTELRNTSTSIFEQDVFCASKGSGSECIFDDDNHMIDQQLDQSLYEHQEESNQLAEQQNSYLDNEVLETESVRDNHRHSDQREACSSDVSNLGSNQISEENSQLLNNNTESGNLIESDSRSDAFVRDLLENSNIESPETEQSSRSTKLNQQRRKRRSSGRKDKVHTRRSKRQTKHVESQAISGVLSCKTCGKTFSSVSARNILRSHEQTHLNIKPFKCELCTKSFLFKRNLDRHIHSHLEEKHFKCNVCGNMFAREANLRDHYSTHSREQPFSCDICGSRFKLERNVKKHKNIYHTGRRELQRVKTFP